MKMQNLITTLNKINPVYKKSYNLFVSLLMLKYHRNNIKMK